MNTTLILTLDGLNTISSIDGNNNHQGVSVVCDMGELLSLNLVDTSVLVIRFDNGELRMTMTLEDIRDLRDEAGILLLRSE